MQWLGLYNFWFLFIIPVILIFYLLKRKYEDREISSVLLWNKLLKDLDANRPWQKLQKNLLLILQLLIAALLITALLKPVIPTSGAIANHTVIVIDTTGSMLAKEGDFTRFETAKQKVSEVINNLVDNQSLTLVQMDQIPKVIFSKSTDKKALQTALNSLKPTPSAGNDITALSLAESIALSEKTSGIMWYGDGANYRMHLRNISLPHGISFKHEKTGNLSENISLASFITTIKENYNEGLIRIENYGIQEKEVNLSIYNYDGQIIDSKTVKVKGNDSSSIVLKDLPISNAYQAIVETDNDGLSEDNNLWSVPFAKTDTTAIMVSANGNRFLSQAVKAVKTVNLDKAEYIPDDSKNADIWFFDGIIPDKLPEGNVLIIAPDKTTDWLSYLGEHELNSKLEVVDDKHPLLKHVNFDDIYISKIRKIGESKQLKPLIKARDEPVILAGSIGGKRVVILAFELQNSDFPLHTAFPIFIQNTIEWLAPEKSLPIGNANPNEKLTIPFSTGIEKKVLITPSGKEFNIDSSGTVVTLEIPEEIGLYKIKEYYQNRESERLFSVQMSETETDIKPKLITINTDTIGKEEGLKEKVTYGYKDLAVWFILLALIVSFFEWVVYQRGY